MNITIDSEIATSLANREIPFIPLQAECPYNQESCIRAWNIYQVVQPKYQDRNHIPPFELAYAAQQGLMNKIRPYVECYCCRTKILGTGIAFPVDVKCNFIVNIPFCEKCSELAPRVVVNRALCQMRLYTWKMVIASKLTNSFYEKILEERKKNLITYSFDQVMSENPSSFRGPEPEPKYIIDNPKSDLLDNPKSDLLEEKVIPEEKVLPEMKDDEKIIDKSIEMKKYDIYQKINEEIHQKIHQKIEEKKKIFVLTLLYGFSLISLPLIVVLILHFSSLRF